MTVVELQTEVRQLEKNIQALCESFTIRTMVNPIVNTQITSTETQSGKISGLKIKVGVDL